VLSDEEHSSRRLLEIKSAVENRTSGSELILELIICFATILISTSNFSRIGLTNRLENSVGVYIHRNFLNFPFNV